MLSRGAHGTGRAQEFGRSGAVRRHSLRRTMTGRKSWRWTSRAHVKDTLGNLALILRNDPRLKDIAYNIHRSGIDIRRDAEGRSSVPWTPIKAGWNEVGPGRAADLSGACLWPVHPVQAQGHSAGHRGGTGLPSHPRLHRIPARVGRRAAGGHAVRGLSGRGGHRLYPRRGAQDDGGGGGARVPAGREV